MERLDVEAQALGVIELTSDVSRTAELFLRTTDSPWSSDAFQSAGA